ncbi:MAG: polyphosphate polymerase domain-containing protein [Deltaproteobacteria bacterium]|nr:polyphosphate polymerase domain-containing protein [Deltaproteobacteria bacterium]MBW2144623.1 polyphosphate polymerase domain-containing protein [Deltaproteobacteria bacterium]
MRRGRQEVTPPVLERYESKFVIPQQLIGPISDFASVYCSLDKYSESAKDNFYRSNNLYFDTPNFLFLMRRKNGNCENRFNMRIRTYSDHSSLPCFFEIKQRNVNVIKKYRAVVHDEDWPRMFEDPGYELDKEKGFETDSNKSLFFRMAYTYNATPKVLSQYLRKAYVSDVDDYARITFDVALRYQAAEGLKLTPDEKKMVPLDNETLFDPGCNVVLELKCYTSYVPLWMIDLVRYFDLRRTSFSKYVTGVDNVISRYMFDSAIRQMA